LKFRFGDLARAKRAKFRGGRVPTGFSMMVLAYPSGSPNSAVRPSRLSCCSANTIRTGTEGAK
jgi:hypothetical protein